MIEVRQTSVFAQWLAALRDRQAKLRISARISRLESGNLGDVKPVGEGVSELRLNFGPGYRLYMTQYGDTFILLLCGGDKGSQDRDIRKANDLIKELNHD